MGLREYNDHTRMTCHQLAARIQQMEATRDRNGSIGSPNDRHRPGEDLHRREKIAIYKEELRRRELADDLAAAIERGREEKAAAIVHEAAEYFSQPTTPEQRTAADLEAFTARLQAEADARACTWCEGTGTVLLTDAPSGVTSRRCTACHGTGKADAESEPCECRMTGDQADASDCPAHNLTRRAEMRNQYDDHANAPPSAEEWQHREEARESKDRAAERAADYNEPRPRPTPVKQWPPTLPLALRIACPQCKAPAGDSCHNYKGQPCSPHTRRKLAAPAQIGDQPTPVDPEPPTPTPNPAPAPPPKVQPIRKARTPAARPTSTPDPSGLTDLDRTIEALVRQHTSGAVIDAAWSAAKRIFHPEAR